MTPCERSVARWLGLQSPKNHHPGAGIGHDPFQNLIRVLPEIVWVLGRTWVVSKGVPSLVRRGVER